MDKPKILIDLDRYNYLISIEEQQSNQNKVIFYYERYFGERSWFQVLEPNEALKISTDLNAEIRKENEELRKTIAEYKKPNGSPFSNIEVEINKSTKSFNKDLDKAIEKLDKEMKEVNRFKGYSKKWWQIWK